MARGLGRRSIPGVSRGQPMLRNSASGPEIGLAGRILAGLLPGPGVVFRGLVSCTCGMPLCQKAIWPILGGPTFWRAFPDPRGRTDFKNAPPKISGPGRSAVPPTPFRPGGVGGIVGARILGPDCVLPHLGPGVFPVSCDTRLRGHRRCHVGCARAGGLPFALSPLCVPGALWQLWPETGTKPAKTKI
jgi:hypothetical protein